MKRKIITVPLWGRDINVLIYGGEVEVVNFAKREKFSQKVIDDIKSDHIDNGARGAVWFCMNKGEGIIWFPNKNVERGILNHEVTHLLDFLCIFIGIEITEWEARAYTAEWLFVEIARVIKNTKS